MVPLDHAVYRHSHDKERNHYDTALDEIRQDHRDLSPNETKDQRDQKGSADTKAKSESLQAYIKEQNKKGKNLFGGIAIQVKGNWLFNQKSSYNWEKCLRNDWDDWDVLHDYINKRS